MKRKSTIYGSLFVSALFLLGSGNAFAQATRTWVSGVGDDVNPCSRTAPCKTWAGAISKTAISGVINCLDSGGFGPVTITKSITIDCRSTIGSGLAASTYGININGANVDVVLRGIDVDGSPDSSPGVTGIRFLQGRSLVIDDVLIRDFKGASPNGNGVMIIHSSGIANIQITNSTISGNGNAVDGSGVQVAPMLAAGARVNISNSIITGNVLGVRADTSNTTGAIDMSISDTTVSNSARNGVVARQVSGPVQIMLDGVKVTGSDQGVRATGGGIIRMGNSVVTGNGTGFSISSGGQILSYGDNKTHGNTVDGAPTGNIPLR